MNQESYWVYVPAQAGTNICFNFPWALWGKNAMLCTYLTISLKKFSKSDWLCLTCKLPVRECISCWSRTPRMYKGNFSVSISVNSTVPVWNWNWFCFYPLQYNKIVSIIFDNYKLLCIFIETSHLFNYLYFSVFNINLFSDGNASTMLPCNEYQNINCINK